MALLMILREGVDTSTNTLSSMIETINLSDVRPDQAAAVKQILNAKRGDIPTDLELGKWRNPIGYICMDCNTGLYTEPIAHMCNGDRREAEDCNFIPRFRFKKFGE